MKLEVGKRVGSIREVVVIFTESENSDRLAYLQTNASRRAADIAERKAAIADKAGQAEQLECKIAAETVSSWKIKKNYFKNEQNKVSTKNDFWNKNKFQGSRQLIIS